ncbi:MAG TPA: hypothetical protein VIH05_08250 [Tepidiformaceae bacterium]
MSLANIVVLHNPATLWERYRRNIPIAQIADWKMVEREEGGYYSATFSFRPKSREDALEFLNNGPGRMTEFYNHRGIGDWEGMVKRVSIDTGIVKVTNDLADMANAVLVRYSPVGGGSPTRSAVKTHAASQTRFGKKYFVLSGGELAAAVADQRAQLYLDQVFWASPRLESVDQGGKFKAEGITVDVQCIGLSEAMDFVLYNQTALTGQVDASVVVTAIFTNAEVMQFIKSYEVATNVTPVSREFDNDRRPMEILKSIASLGDSNRNPYVVGVEGDRHAYFRQGVPYRIPGQT